MRCRIQRTRQQHVRKGNPRYELQHDGEVTPLSIYDEEMYLQRITPITMAERGRRLRAAFPSVWAEHDLIAAIRRVA